MIPKRLIKKAALAARENDRVGKWRGLEWEDLDGYTQSSYLNNARAALEAVAADIWAEGAETMIDGHDTTWINDQNPYKRIEHT